LLKALNLQSIVEKINGKVIKGDTEIIIKDVVKHFKNIKDNILFLDIRKRKSFNADLLIQYNAVAIVTDEPEKFSCIEGNFTLIQVEDIKDAYWKFVEYYRSLFLIPIVAVTGTCGKTTTCHMIRHILSKKYKVNSTISAVKIRETLNSYRNNLNYLSKIDEKTQAAVYETAVAAPGQLSNTCRHFKPQIRILLNIGVYHLKGCKTPEGYINAKAEIIEGMDPIKDLLILNADDENIKKIDISKVERIIYFGIDNKADFQAKDIVCSSKGTNFTISYRDKSYKGYINMLGKHNVYNAMAAVIAVKAIGIDIEEALEHLKTFKSVYKHLELKTFKGGLQILDDSWNNTPTSMESALSVLKDIANGRRKIAVFGLMPALGTGKYAQEQFAKMGRKVVEAGVDMLIIIGDIPKEIGRTAIRLGMDKNNVFYAKDQMDVDSYLRPYLDKNTIILFKSSEENVNL
jgi:UDP-N-acetylmuramoyl-tripeptide--D-alanyl-D-alanine ligase